MASLIKTAAVSVAMKKCPFLSNETLTFALKSKGFSTMAKKCPVMSKLMAKGVVTLPVTEEIGFISFFCKISLSKDNHLSTYSS